MNTQWIVNIYGAPFGGGVMSSLFSIEAKTEKEAEKIAKKILEEEKKSWNLHLEYFVVTQVNKVKRWY